MTKKNQYTVTDQLITRITAWIAGLVVIALLIWGGCWIWESYHYEETNDAQVQEYINPVISRAGGFIVKINFEENQEVKKGDTLIIIDNREYKIQQQQTEAALQNAQAQLKVLESNVRTLQQTALVGKSAINGSKARLVKQQLDYDRYVILYNAESATKQQLENVRSTLDVALSDYQSAQDSYRASLLKVNDVQTQQGVVRAEIKRLQALLERHKLDVSYTAIRAPYDCRIGKRTIERGQMIDPGQILAYIVNKESDKWVVANFKETQVSHMHIGQIAEIDADAFPNQHFAGKIISLSPATGSSFSLLPPDNATGNFVKIVQRVPVRIRLIDKKSIIAPLESGMNVNVLIPRK